MTLVAPGINYPDPPWTRVARIVGGGPAVPNPNDPFNGSARFSGVPSAPQAAVVTRSTGLQLNLVSATHGFGPGIGRNVPPLPTADASVGMIQAGVTFVPR
jgi:hypothetical protein